MIQAMDVPSDDTVIVRATPGSRRPGRPSRSVRARQRGLSAGAASRSRQGADELDAPELWQRTTEPYPGAVVLEDLARGPADAAAAQRILARFAALRLVLMILEGGLAKPGIGEERAIAQTYVDALPLGDAERRALDRMMAAAVSDRLRDIAIEALEAADHAAHQGHDAGAYWLYRTAYTLSRTRRCTSEALHAANAIAAAARAGHAPRAVRAWRRRIRTIRRQASARAQRAATDEE